MIDILQRIHRLLVKNAAFGQALVVEKLIHFRDANQAEFTRLLQGRDVWGGSGAVWEVGQLGRDSALFWDAVIALADDMERQGLGTERSHFVAETLRGWRAAGYSVNQ